MLWIPLRVKQTAADGHRARRAVNPAPAPDGDAARVRCHPFPEHRSASGRERGPSLHSFGLDSRSAVSRLVSIPFFDGIPGFGWSAGRRAIRQAHRR